MTFRLLLYQKQLLEFHNFYDIFKLFRVAGFLPFKSVGKVIGIESISYIQTLVETIDVECKAAQGKDGAGEIPLLTESSQYYFLNSPHLTLNSPDLSNNSPDMALNFPDLSDNSPYMAPSSPDLNEKLELKIIAFVFGIYSNETLSKASREAVRMINT